MKLLFHDEGWEDYLHWQHTDIKILKRINELIRIAGDLLLMESENRNR